MFNMANGTKGFLGSVHNTANTEMYPKKTTTFEGGNAYELNFEEKLCNAFTLGLIQGNFYVKQEDIIKNTRDLFAEALQKNPLLATKYAVYAAEELGMKFMPTLWLVYLSTLEDKKLFKKAFPRIIGTNVKLLHDFVNLCRQSDIRPGGIHTQKVKNTNRGLGQGLKKTINKWLYANVNDYNATRFTNKLEDVCRLTRPEDRTVERTGKESTYKIDLTQYFQYIFQPRDKEGKTLPRRLTFKRAQMLQKSANASRDN
jgi:hypothetical protein